MLQPNHTARALVPTLRAWSRDWGGLLTIITLVSSLGYALWMGLALGDPSVRAWAGNVGSVVVTAVAIILAFRAARTHQLHPSIRRGWLFFGLAFLANGLGSTAWMVYENILQQYPSASWADIGWLSFYPLLLVAILIFPTAPRSRSDRATFWLDAGTVLIGGGMLIWFFSVLPRAGAELGDIWLMVLLLAYPVGDLVALFGLTRIAFSQPDPRTAVPIRMLGIGLLANIIANLGYASMVMAGTYQTGTWPSALWVIAFCACAVAAQLQLTYGSERLAQTETSVPGADSLSLLPYAGIAVGFGLLLVVTVQNWTRPLGDLIIGASVLTIVVLTRQIIAVRENIRLTAARNAAMQASQLKSEFLANMSHELRTPLNSIINFTRIISTGARGPVTPEQQDYLNRVRQSGEHLLGLINDILDLSKIEAGRLELVREPLHIGDLIQSIMATAAGLTKEKPIELRSEVAPQLPLLEVDRTRIRQVLLNLLSNAAKFTDAGAITVRAEQHVDGVAIHITDTGIGIAREHLGTIFEEFRQVDSASNRRYDGTGLGLPICKRLVELHGGRMWVESTPGVGSTFSFSLPLTAVHAMPVVAPKLPTSVLPGGVPIVVVDDDPSAIEIVRSYLARDGYSVTAVTDSRKALEVIQQVRPKAVILDVLMPHRDGWEVLADLQADALLKHIPVALYTIVEQQQLGFYLGASAYLMKPIDESQLRSTMAQLVQPDALVVVIDDDPNQLEIIAAQLGHAGGYQVTTANSGAQGWAEIVRVRPDLIILDLMMPEVDGFTVLERLSADPYLEQIPVIILSAKELTLQERSYLAQRVKTHLAKGETAPEELLGKVLDLLHMRSTPAATITD